MDVRARLSALFKDKEEFDVTAGGIGRPLFYLSLPIVVTNLLQTAYNLADTFWLGQYSTDALAAISFAFPIIFLLISLGLGLSVAGSVLVAQNTGAGNESGAEYAASQTVSFTFIAAILLSAVGYVFVDDLLALFGASPDVLPLATAYMQVISAGIVFMFGFIIFISLMRGYGDTVTPMLVMLGTVVLNIALDPLLIFGWGPFPQWGMAGAAIATVFSRAMAMVVGLGIMFSGRRGVELHLSQMKPDLEYLRKILRIGLPASIGGTGRALSINALLFIIGTFPTPVVAAFGIGTRVFSVVFLPAIGLARGVETMSGQNIGAGEFDRAAHTSYFAAKAMLAILSAVAVVAWVFAPGIVGVFTDDPHVVDLGTTFVRTVAPTFGFIGVMRVFAGGFRGAGKTLVAAAVSILMLGVIRLPAAWIGAHTLGESGVWLSFAVSNVAGALIAFLWYRRGTWRGASLADERPETAAGADTTGADTTGADTTGADD